MPEPKKHPADAAFTKVIELVNQKQLSAAIQSATAAVNNYRNDVRLNAIAGGLLLNAGNLTKAEPYLRHAASLAPDFAKVQEDLGYLLLKAGKNEEAVVYLKKAVTLNPESKSGKRWLARALALTDAANADGSFDNDTLDPAEAALAQAKALSDTGQKKAAENIYNSLLAEHPNNPSVLGAIARVCAANKQLPEAEKLYRRAMAQAPHDADLLAAFGTFLSEQNHHDEALKHLTQATTRKPQDAGTRHQLAWAFVRAGQTTVATDHFRAVLTLQPDHQGAWLGLGHNLKTIGRLAEAIEAYRNCIKLHPNDGEVYWSLANLKTYKFSDTDRNAMKTALDHENLTDRSRVNFLFALAKSYEDINDYANSWQNYQAGNNLQRSLIQYSAAHTAERHSKIIDTFSNAFLQDRADTGNDNPAPIFIVGLPRSGSTLLEQILASHSMVEGTSELTYISRLTNSLTHGASESNRYPQDLAKLQPSDLKRLGTEYLGEARHHRLTDKPRFIDKMPNNFPHIGFIKLILPKAKIIDARRYPLDSTLSCYRQLFTRGQTFVYELKDIGQYFLEYQRMMDHWHAVMPGEVLTVQYEDVTTDLEFQVRRILDYCELPFEDTCLRFHENDRPVRTASSEQVRQPIYTGAIHQWRQFEPYLGELIDTLAPILPRYQQYESINKT